MYIVFIEKIYLPTKDVEFISDFVDWIETVRLDLEQANM